MTSAYRLTHERVKTFDRKSFVNRFGSTAGEGLGPHRRKGWGREVHVE